MEKLRVPKGKFISIKTEKKESFIVVKLANYSRQLALMNFGFLGDIKACSSIFCEAGNVYNEIGLTPKELQKENRKLRKVLSTITNSYKSPDSLREDEESRIPFEETLELAYDDIRQEAKDCLEEIGKIKLLNKLL